MFPSHSFAGQWALLCWPRECSCSACVAYHFLPVAPLPKVDFPTISVSAQEPGVDPARLRRRWPLHWRRRFAQIAGVDEITSVSSLGGSTITIQFDLNRDINGAARDVQSAIDAASGELPSGSAAAAVLSQTQSIGRADHGPGHDLGYAAVVGSL